MKKAILLLGILIPMLCQGQTKAKGVVIADEPYEVWIKDIDRNDSIISIRWELWEMYEEYHLTIEPNEQIKAYWVSQCTSDTIATAIFNGMNEKLNVNDEKHICPLQLDTIERILHLYSNEGETVFSPFGGIGSEGYSALKMGRKSISIELKESYFSLNEKNHKAATIENSTLQLF